MARNSIGMICLQTQAGLIFGNTVSLTRKGVNIEVDARLAPGDEMGWRMELRGWEGTVSGRLVVGRVERVPGEPVVFVGARFTAMAPEDERLFHQWLEEQEEGGTPRRIERNPNLLQPDIGADGMVGATPDETAHALARMTDRRDRARRMRHAAQARSTTPLSDHSDIGLARESHTNRESVSKGREAMRSALKQGLSQVSGVSSSRSSTSHQSTRRSRLAEVLRRTERLRQGLESTGPESAPRTGARPLVGPPPRSVSPPPRSVSPPPRDESVAPPPAEAPAPPPPAAERTPQPVAQRHVHLHDSTPPTVVVVYPDLPALQVDYRASLSSNGLMIPRLVPGWRIFEALKLEIMLPGGGVIRCSATLVAEMGAAVALSLELKPSERARLQQLAG